VPDERRQDEGWREPRHHDPLNREHDHSGLRSMSRVKQTVLRRLRRARRTRASRPRPEFREIEPRPPRQIHDCASSGARRVDHCEEQLHVLPPICQEDRLGEAASTDEDVIRRCRLRRGRQNETSSDGRCRGERCEPTLHERYAGKYVPVVPRGPVRASSRTVCRCQRSRAGMILPWIRQRSSGLARRAAARFRRSGFRGPYCAGSDGCVPTATTRRYHE
jgi:hypothetical protein